MLVTNAPTVVSAPIWQHPTDVRSRKLSAYTQTAAPVVAPPPTWGCASEKARKNSATTTYLPPAPFSALGEDHQQSQHSSGSSSWGVTNNKASKNGSRSKDSPQQLSWDKDQNSGKANSTWGGVDNSATVWNDDQAKDWGDNNAAEQRIDGWNTDTKGDSGWGISNDTEEKPADGWNTHNNDTSRDQTDSKDAAVDGFNPDSQGNGWGHAYTSKEEQNNSGGFDDTNNGWGAAQDTNGAWGQRQDTANDVPFNTDAGDAWAAPVAVDEKANENDKPPSASKRHTSQSLSKYRQLSSASLTKPHWQFPPAPSKKTLQPTEEDASERSGRTRRVPSVPSEPLYKIPKAAADEKGVEHQVLAGPGTAYGHAISRPEYIDRLDKPYAVFRFKYRSRSMLKGMFGSDCLSKTGTAHKVVEKEDLKALPQEELIQKMLALQMKLAEKEGDGGSQCTESVAKDLTEKWVKQHSREASEKDKKAKTEKSAGKVGAWDDGAQGFDPEKAGVKW